ncbi:hypothetical protein [Ruegeria jejuensis]|uniref:hypothetical protein n=1 Tax=Ruegeria jejuensis TaxID=3233338 RepID=UPI00355B49FD
MAQITGYHAHAYFDEITQDVARQVCDEAARLFPVEMGRMHAKRLCCTNRLGDSLFESSMIAG